MKSQSYRIPELDIVRGLCILGMVIHHFTNSVRYLFRIDMFAFQEGQLFMLFIRPIFLAGFIGVSGLSTAFSRNHTKRGLRIGAFALLISLAMFIYSKVSHTDYYIFFNVLHVLAACQLIYAAVHKLLWEHRRVFFLALSLIAIMLLFGGYSMMQLEGTISTPVIGYLRLFLGGTYDQAVGMADFMPLLPYGGIFFIAAITSHLIYADRRSIFEPRVEQWLRRYLAPLAWMGEHPLWIYLLHQPIIVTILFLLLGKP